MSTAYTLFTNALPMPDPYLEAMLHGEFARSQSKVLPVKGQFERAAERHIDQYVDALILEEQHHPSELAKALKSRNQIKLEILESIKLADCATSIAAAIKFLISQGGLYQNAELQSGMLRQFERLEQALADFDINNTSLDILSLENEHKDSILNIAIGKYAKEECQLAMDMLVLLVVFDSDNSDYWYRLGIAAQKCQNFPLAAKSYAVSIKLQPDRLGAHLFSVECHLRLGDVFAARAEFDQAKRLLNPKIGDEWVNYVHLVEQNLNSLSEERAL